MKPLNRIISRKNLVPLLTLGVLVLAAAGKLIGLVQMPGTADWKALIAPIELIAAGLIWGTSTRRLGGWLCAGLGAAFLVYQVASAALGLEACACFGALAPSWRAYNLAAAGLLFGGGLLTARPEGWTAKLTPTAGTWKRALPALALSALAIAWFRGESLAQSRSAEPMAPSVNLRIGQVAPVLSLPQPNGVEAVIGGKKGHWTFYAFVQRGCDACVRLEEQLNSARRSMPAVEFVRVIVGKPAFGFLLRTEPQSSGVAALYDANGEAARKYCDQPDRLPFAVLVSPQGRVRAIFDGYRQEGSRLTERLNSIIEFEARAALKRRPGRLPTESQEDSPRLLTFIQQGCYPCEDFQRTLERVLPRGNEFESQFEVQRRYVALSRNVAISDAIVGTEAQSLVRRFDVKSTPTSILIDSENKVLLRISGALDTDTFQELLESKLP